MDLIPGPTGSLARTWLCQGLVVCTAVRASGSGSRPHGRMRASSTKRRARPFYLCPYVEFDEPCSTAPVDAEELDHLARWRVVHRLARWPGMAAVAPAPPSPALESTRARLGALRAERRATAPPPAPGARLALRDNASQWRQVAAKLRELDRARVLAEFATPDVVATARGFQAGRMPWTRLSPLAHRFDDLPLADRRILTTTVIAAVRVRPFSAWNGWPGEEPTHLQVSFEYRGPFVPPRHASPRAGAPYARAPASVPPVLDGDLLTELFSDPDAGPLGPLGG